jgi:tetrahydromethanopterin S-methyltransferase subunit D
VTAEVLLKHPLDSIDFTMQWINLAGATVTAVTHSVPVGSGLSIVGQSNTTGTSTVQLSGGTHGRVYPITGTATLSNGRTLVRTFALRLLAH